MVILNISPACKLIPPVRSEEPVINSRFSVSSLVGRVASLIFFRTFFMLYYLGASPAGKIIVVSIINNS